MRARTLPVISAVLLFGACGATPRVATVATPARTHAENAIEVVRSGSMVSGMHVYAAALLRNKGAAPVESIGLRLTLRDDKGETIDTADETLPYCPPDQDCWWATGFAADQFGSRSGEIASAGVAVSYGGRPVDRTPAVQTFAVERGPDGSLRGTAPGDEGIAYVVASDGSSPTAGLAYAVSPKPPYQSDRSIRIPAGDLPSLGASERLLGAFYAQEVSAGL